MPGSNSTLKLMSYTIQRESLTIQPCNSLRQNLETAQAHLQDDPLNQDLIHIENRARDSYKALFSSEESMIRQKSRQNWLQLGDSNTAFFYASFVGRKARNTLRRVSLPNGDTSNDPSTVKAYTVNNFTQLLNQSHSAGMAQMDFKTKLSSLEAAQLITEVTGKEIYSTLKQMKANGSSGPDGFNPFFFFHCWEVVGSDVVAAVKEFFSSGRLLKQLNHSFICLVPKVVSADSYLSNGGNTERAAIKVDLSKAFDSIRWEFIYQVMHDMHFPVRWIGWIRECIETPKYSVLINGSPNGFFGATCGLRQGDPISPLLFVLVMEAFTYQIDRSIMEGRIEPYLKGRVQISHLIFADDLILFSNGSPNSARGINSLFRDFAESSGLKLNPAKSQAFLSKTFSAPTEFIASLGIKAGTLPVRYLGLPLLDKALSHSSCLPLLDKLRARIMGWKGHLLSFAGRVELVKTVLNSLQIFWSASFLLPQKIMAAVEKLFRCFLWGGPTLKKAMHHVDWKTICLPKQEGGLGIKGLKDWAKGSLGAKFWEIATRRSSLWVDWIYCRYIKSGSIWRISCASGSTKSWKAILQPGMDSTGSQVPHFFRERSKPMG
ncbi:hypothetical protein QJS10_CPB04g01152 [Acorus calamus]|uniref:Reverse transcriptase domain-containing protein n=1 Tax=Acorus calamus TaxID=4465 RepID=A0AAV9EZI8_ACOCL|nr:hypothetical protein QJS10_CPB04g01152 [Acorus calamus]